MSSADTDKDAHVSSLDDVLRLHAKERKRGRRGRRGRSSKRLSPLLEGMMGEANMHYAAGELEKAREKCENVIHQSPNAPAPHHTLGLVLEALDEPEQALKSYRTSVSLDKSQPELWKRIGQLQRALGYREDSLASFQRAYNSNRDDIATAMDIATLSLELGHRNKALRVFRTLLNHPDADVAALHVQLASVLFEQNRLEETAEALEDSISYVLGKDLRGLATKEGEDEEEEEEDEEEEEEEDSDDDDDDDDDEGDEDGDEEEEDDEEDEEDGGDANEETAQQGDGRGTTTEATASRKRPRAPSRDSASSAPPSKAARVDRSSKKATGNVPASLSRPIQPHPEALPTALDACNMLCELYLSSQRYQAVVDTVERLHAFAMAVHQSELPVDIFAKYGAALLRVGRFRDAESALAPLWRQGNVLEYIDLYEEVAAAFQATNRPETALTLWRRVESAYRESDGEDNDAVAGGGDGSSSKSLAHVNVRIAECLEALGRSADAVPRFESAAQDSSDPLPLLLRAAYIRCMKLHDAQGALTFLLNCESLTDRRGARSLVGYHTSLCAARAGQHRVALELGEETLTATSSSAVLLCASIGRRRFVRWVKRIVDALVGRGRISAALKIASALTLRARRGGLPLGGVDPTVAAKERRTAEDKDAVRFQAEEEEGNEDADDSATQPHNAHGDGDGDDDEDWVFEVGPPQPLSHVQSPWMADQMQALFSRVLMRAIQRGKPDFALDHCRQPIFSNGTESAWRVLGWILASGSTISAGVFKAMRYHLTQDPDSLPVTLATAHHAAFSGSTLLAFAQYSTAIRADPENPLIALCLAMNYISRLNSRMVRARNQPMSAAWAAMDRYATLRHRMGQALAGGGDGAQGEGGDRRGRAAMDNSDESFHLSDQEVDRVAVEADAATRPADLPEFVLKWETEYNGARLAHQVGLATAVGQYEALLERIDTEWEEWAQWVTEHPVCHPSAVDLRRDAAWNLVPLYHARKQPALARRVQEKYLSWDISADDAQALAQRWEAE